MSRPVAEQSSQGRLSVAWRYGGAAEHAMIVALLVCYFLMVLPFVIEVLVFTGRWSPNEFNQTALAFFPAAASWPAYKTPIYEAMFTPACYRARLTRRDITPAERRYVAEYARFKEAIGTQGQFPGGTRLGATYLALYLGLCLAAYPYAALAFPVLGDLTALPYVILAILFALVCWVYSWRGQKTLFNLARAKGFHLTELKNELVQSRLPRRT